MATSISFVAPLPRRLPLNRPLTLSAPFFARTDFGLNGQPCPWQRIFTEAPEGTPLTVAVSGGSLRLGVKAIGSEAALV